VAAYDKGLHDLGGGHFAYLQPSGTWGYSNAGLIKDGEAALLVDTLFDERLTAEMLQTMKDATGIGAGDIAQLVNTHANGDHTFGNRLLTNARIIASAAGAEEMAHEGSPELLAGLMSQTAQLGRLGKYLDAIFGAFDFAGVKLKLPDTTFTGQTTLKVGDKDVELIEVGPAHTAGDTLIHAPKDRVVYTGDILFIEGTPIMWQGPVGNWLAACDKILAMDVEAIVPGHGPLTDKAGVRKMREYLAFVDAETRKRHAAGMDAWTAAQDIALGEFGAWSDAERLAVTVDTIYREIDKDAPPRNVMTLFDRMAQLEERYRSHQGHSH
jgi:glyoxylase-like metal-dependent hydrolase (beta-lactamase superfamily II)